MIHSYSITIQRHNCIMIMALNSLPSKLLLQHSIQCLHPDLLTRLQLRIIVLPLNWLLCLRHSRSMDINFLVILRSPSPRLLLPRNRRLIHGAASPWACQGTYPDSQQRAITPNHGIQFIQTSLTTCKDIKSPCKINRASVVQLAKPLKSTPPISPLYRL